MKSKEESKKKEDNSTNERTKTIIPNFLDSAVIIAIITGILYLISFFYLKGFFSYYGLTDVEIDFSLFRVLKVCLEILQPLLCWILVYSVLALVLVKMQNNPSINTFFYTLWVFMLSLLFLRTSLYETKKLMSIFYLVLGIALIAFLVLGFIINNCLPDKYKEIILNFVEIKENKVFIYIYKILCFLGAIITIVSFIPKYGYNEAKIKNDYLFDSQNQRILIYQDNEKSVFLPKKENGNFEKKYIIVSTSDLSNILLEHYEQTIQFENKDVNGKN